MQHVPTSSIKVGSRQSPLSSNRLSQSHSSRFIFKGGEGGVAGLLFCLSIFFTFLSGDISPLRSEGAVRSACFDFFSTISDIIRTSGGITLCSMMVCPSGLSVALSLRSALHGGYSVEDRFSSTWIDLGAGTISIDKSFASISSDALDKRFIPVSVVLSLRSSIASVSFSSADKTDTFRSDLSDSFRVRSKNSLSNFESFVFSGLQQLSRSFELLFVFAASTLDVAWPVVVFEFCVLFPSSTLELLRCLGT